MKSTKENQQELKSSKELKEARMSITTRISLNYLRLLVICGALFIFIFQFVFINEAKAPYRENAETIIVNLESGNYKLSETLSSYNKDYPSVKIMNKKTSEIVYNDINYSFTEFMGVLTKVYFSFEDEEHRLVITEKFPLIIDDVELVATVYYNMTEDFARAIRLMIEMIITYGILVICIIVEGRNENKAILKPLRRMSNSLERLSVNNLHSERLDIIGANDELKDLAIVCNEMLDRLELSYESQKQFVSNASHELRTPIAVIQGYSNLLNRWGSKDPEILDEAIVAICNVSKEMQDLVEKLLFLSRHDRRTLKLKKDWFDIKDVVEDLLKEVDLVIENRNIECPAMESVEIYGDKQMIKQAMRVFIDNAVKYTQDGDTIKISCRNIRGSSELTVEDTGIGMRRKDLNNIFERFYRSDDVRDKNISGHGLGLSIAKLIIMSHSGRIKIRTQYTHGTTFIITLPRRK